MGDYYSEIEIRNESSVHKCKFISSHHQIPTSKDILSKKAQINCIDVAKSFYFKRNYVSVGLQNGNICIYDVESSKLKMECRNDSGAHITKCKFFPFGDLILSGDTKACLSIFAIAD